MCTEGLCMPEMGDTWFSHRYRYRLGHRNTDTDNGIMASVSTIPIPILSVGGQGVGQWYWYRYFCLTVFRIFTDADTNIASGISAVLVPILVSGFEIHWCRYQWLVPRARMSVSDIDAKVPRMGDTCCLTNTNTDTDTDTDTDTNTNTNTDVPFCWCKNSSIAYYRYVPEYWGVMLTICNHTGYCDQGYALSQCVRVVYVCQRWAIHGFSPVPILIWSQQYWYR